MENMKEQRKAGIVSAFYSAYFSRLKTLSNKELDQVLSQIDNTEDTKMSDEEMFYVIKNLSMMGGT